jgi:hypothetical protein
MFGDPVEAPHGRPLPVRPERAQPFFDGPGPPDLQGAWMPRMVSKIFVSCTNDLPAVGGGEPIASQANAGCPDPGRLTHGDPGRTVQTVLASRATRPTAPYRPTRVTYPTVATPEEWDAAISFVDGDIASARRIVDLLKDRASVFLYANHQDQLVGSDGVVTLSNVYGRRARLVVVLYRATWGNTDWTSIERSAINSRRLNDRTDEFLTVVKMEDVATPTWLPTARIYGRWEPLGAEGVAGAIVTRLQELGTHVRPETAADLARRMAAEQEWKDHREKYLNEKGWDAGAAQVVMAFDALERLAA